MQYVSSTPATRLDVITLQEKLDQQLQQRQVGQHGGWAFKSAWPPQQSTLGANLVAQEWALTTTCTIPVCAGQGDGHLPCA